MVGRAEQQACHVGHGETDEGDGAAVGGGDGREHAGDQKEKGAGEAGVDVLEYGISHLVQSKTSEVRQGNELTITLRYKKK